MTARDTRSDDIQPPVQEGAALITEGQIIGHVSGMVVRSEKVTDFIVTPGEGGKEWLIPAAWCDLSASGPDRLMLPPAPEATNPKVLEDAEAISSRRIPLAAEQLITHVRQVDRGTVRVQRRVETEPVVEMIDLTRDDVEIEYREINEPAATVALPHYDGDTLVVPEYEELPVVTKRLILRKEIRITKRSITEEVRIEETVRRDVVDVQHLDPPANGDE